MLPPELLFRPVLIRWSLMAFLIGSVARSWSTLSKGLPRRPNEFPKYQFCDRTVLPCPSLCSPFVSPFSSGVSDGAGVVYLILCPGRTRYPKGLLAKCGALLEEAPPTCVAD